MAGTGSAAKDRVARDTSSADICDTMDGQAGGKASLALHRQRSSISCPGQGLQCHALLGANGGTLLDHSLEVQDPGLARCGGLEGQHCRRAQPA